MIAVVDWSAFAYAFGMALIGAMTAWTAWRQKKDSVVIEQTHVLVNSNMGAVLSTALTSAKALVVAKPTPENKELLKVAEAQYAEHQLKQAIADQVKT